MQTFDQALIEAYKSGLISRVEAIRHADSANDVRLNIKLHEHGAEALTESTDFEVE
jgi:twitching motility protein PilU